MERAKRLELIALLLQASINERCCETKPEANAAGHAPDKIRGFPTEKVRVWAEEIDEIIRVWPVIGQGVQQGLLAFVRAQGLRSTDA